MLRTAELEHGDVNLLIDLAETACLAYATEVLEGARRVLR